MNFLAATDTLLFDYNGPRALGEGGNDTLTAIFTIAFGVLGGISLIVIVISGMRLTLSRGNPEALAKLRSTIIYAAVGLAVALGATAIIQFVIEKV
ncbi:MAG: hypothetical protein AAB624_03975 [Patescibacteria group bacterium]